jgi:hypothetical protein
MQISSPAYSFVKFDSTEAFNNCCNGDQEFCIPLIEETDTYFQIKITSDDYAEIQAIMSSPPEAFDLLLLAGSGNTPDNFSANVIRDWTVNDGLVFEINRTGILEITLQWRSPFKDIKTLIDCGNCFQLAFIRTGEFSGEFSDEFGDEFDMDGETVTYDFIAISNCFKRFCDDCFTSVLEYYNDDDYAEFNYCNMTNPVNRVRLPFYLTQPKMIEVKAVYRKSNGGIIQTRSLITKEYQALTDHLPEWVHDKITIALAHDFTNVFSGSYEGGISKNGEYVIEWNDNDCTAPAGFKAEATPLSIRNNNCQDCEEIELCSPPVVPEFTLPDGNVGEPYIHTETITGFQPFNIVVDEKPSWMTILLDGPDLKFTGTPDEEGTEIEVSFSVSNLCTDAFTISKNINIDIMTPGMILMWSGDPSAVPTGWALCDGTGGTPNLSGMFIVGYSAIDPDYDTIGDDGGEKTHTLIGAEQGSIKLKGTIDDPDGGSGLNVLGGLTVNGQSVPKDGAANQTGDGTEITVRLNNDSDPHENRPPYFTLAYIMKI